MKTGEKLLNHYLKKIKKIIGHTVRIEIWRQAQWMAARNEWDPQRLYDGSSCQTDDDFRIVLVEPPAGVYAVIAGWHMCTFASCNNICVSHSVYVGNSWRGRGMGTLLNQLRVEIARAQGYSALICTARADNASQQAILKKVGWKRLYTLFTRPDGDEINLNIFPL